MNPQDILNANLNDLVFENKNKAYGAYLLRKIYGRHMLIATLISVFVFTLGFSLPTIIDKLKGDETTDEILKPKITTLSEPPSLEKLPPPPPVQNIPPPPKTVKFTPPIIKEDKEVDPEEIPPTQKDLEAPPIGDENTVDPNANVDFSDAPVEVVEKKEPEILVFVEQMPEFPGGTTALYEYLNKNLRYPPLAREAGAEGKVTVKFVVDENGEISQITVLRDIGYGTDDEARRVIKGMPKWKAGKQNGKAVKVWYTLPIAFKLSSTQ